ncbi:MAG: DUF4399 domain-containing protein [Pseudomonadota bacterium]
MKTLLMAAATAILATAAGADGHRTEAPEGAKVYIISPADGATVSNPVTIVFGLEGMGVAPAGTDVDDTGHHHLLINTDPAEVDMNEPLPATDQIVHFGGGQTQVTKELPSGTHSLRLLLGDLNHVPHDPPVMSEAISITVE